jgi:hypothetical protein
MPVRITSGRYRGLCYTDVAAGHLCGFTEVTRTRRTCEELVENPLP